VGAEDAIGDGTDGKAGARSSTLGEREMTSDA
jgi:hypothetical protein